MLERFTDFEVGDEVYVRSWEDMEAEYGIDEEDGAILCAYAFKF